MEQILGRKFSKEKTQKSFAAVSKFYDAWAKITESKAMDSALSKIKGDINGYVLDIGVGTGDMFYRIVPLNKEGYNVGLDISPQMLFKAKKKLNGNIKSKTILILGNAFNLPFGDNSFDYIFSSYVFDLLPEEEFETITKEVYRVLKKNGKVVIITMSFGYRWYNKLWFYIAKYFPGILTNCRPIDLKPYFYSNFRDVNVVNISQNTFPSEILTAVKI
jgi:ubiquinone/menaquinone biosynthesis C-methylase UbiE